MAAIEALDRGLAIVSSRIGGVNDVVEDGVNGATCDLTPEGFAAALQKVLGDPDRLRSMREASSRMAEKFDLPRILDAYERILRAAASGAA